MQGNNDPQMYPQGNIYPDFFYEAVFSDLPPVGQAQQQPEYELPSSSSPAYYYYSPPSTSSSSSSSPSSIASSSPQSSPAFSRMESPLESPRSSPSLTDAAAESSKLPNSNRRGRKPKEPELMPKKSSREKPKCPADFKIRLKSHMESHRLRLSSKDYDVLDSNFILQMFKKSVKFRRNSELFLFVRHKRTGHLILYCPSVLMNRLKRPQVHLKQLELVYGFERAKFTQNHECRNLESFGPFIQAIPDFVTSRPELESFSGYIKTYYRTEAQSHFPEPPQIPVATPETIEFPRFERAHQASSPLGDS